MNTVITEEFWKQRRQLVRTEMIPYQWDVLNDRIDITIELERDDTQNESEKSHAVENFKIAAGLTKGDHYGWVFQDSDVYKWLEAAAYSLRETEDPELLKKADSIVHLIAQAQQEDGYLNTYFTIRCPERRFHRLAESHELYCAGHFLEAAVAYHEVTGNQEVLDVAVKLADCIDRSFGPEDGKIHGTDGHEEIEIGLMKLYRLTGEKRYLELCRFFLEVRGTNPNFFAEQRKTDPGSEPVIPGMIAAPKYYQMHKPVLEQTTAEGHAVRQVYLLTAMADYAAQSGDRRFYEAAKTVWRDIVDRRMYITGGIGSTYLGEAFTLDYDLPNDTMYCETCASVGLIFFADRMLDNEPVGEYGDVMERALCNTALAGMALDGKHFFYVNPLEVNPAKSKNDPGKSHVKPVRPEWLGCACCPPNLARLLASLEQYIYKKYTCQSGRSVLFVNLYMGSTYADETGDIQVTQTGDYLTDGSVCLAVSSKEGALGAIALRIPSWALPDAAASVEEVKDAGVSLTVNGAAPSDSDLAYRDGVLFLTGDFTKAQVEIKFPMDVQRWYADPLISEDIGRTALSRGPFVYCLESVDNGEGLHLLSLSDSAEATWHEEKDLLGGVGVIEAVGERLVPKTQTKGAYKKIRQYTSEKQTLRFIPYYAWANRGENEMSVWVRS